MTSEGPPGPAEAESPVPELDPAQLHRLEAVPSGSAALAGVAVLLLLAGWLFVYLFIYLPRGMVG
jgi:hypothetical protein